MASFVSSQHAVCVLIIIVPKLDSEVRQYNLLHDDDDYDYDDDDNDGGPQPSSTKDGRPFLGCHLNNSTSLIYNNKQTD